jgi:dipeptidyl aminopeptidase/acylaminoacyl peptidase
MTWLDMQEMRGVTAPALARDGRRLLYALATPDWKRVSSQSDIYLVSIDGGLPSTKRLTLTDALQEARPTWMPDGVRFVFASNPDGPSQLYVMHPDSAGQQRKVTSAPAGVGPYEFSPDGKWLVYRSGRTANDQQLHALPVEGLLAGGEPAPRQLTRHAAGVGTWKFSPDARRIYFTGPVSVDSLDEERREARFTVQLLDPVTPLTGLWSVELATGATTPVIVDTSRTVGDFSVSPDGRWLAFRALPSDRHKRNAGVESVLYADQWLLELATGRTERLTDNADVPETSASFSPDSRWIAFGAADDMRGINRNRRAYLRRVDDRGGKWRKLGADFDGDVGTDFWSADARTIFFNAGVRATTQLFALDVASGKVRQLTNVPGVVSALPQRDPSHPLLVLYQDPASPPDAYAARTVADLADRATWTRLTRANPQLEAVALGETSEITWKSTDGATVGGVLVKPVGWVPGRRYPLLVILHGGPHAAETMTFNGDDNDGPQVYAGAGYLVLAPNYRGSTNYGERFKLAVLGDYSTLPFADVMSGVDHLVAQGLADSTRMGVAGHSAGGTLGNWILTHTDRFKAVSTGAGVVNWISMYGTSDFQRPREDWFDGKPPYEHFDAYWNQSPLKYIRNARTPTLIYSTEGDVRVPSGQARELYTALRRLGVPAELYLYPGTQHGTPGPRNRLAHGIAEMAWMDYYVRGSGRPFTWKDVLATVKADAAAPAPAVQVPEAVLRRYEGEYELAPGRSVVVTLEDGALFGQPTGQAKVRLVPESETKFFVGRAGSSTQLTFTVDASGTTTGLVMSQGGNMRAGRKVK